VNGIAQSSRPDDRDTLTLGMSIVSQSEVISD